MLFVMEYAHWFYEDNLVENDPSLKSLTFKEFTSLCILQHSHHTLIDLLLLSFNNIKHHFSKEMIGCIAVTLVPRFICFAGNSP